MAGAACRAEVCGRGSQDDLIHVDCASHVYPDGTPGLHDMCFHVRRREIVVVCGANGSGKSTLLEHLNGLLLPSSGQVYVLGKPFPELKRTIWRHVGLIFQRSDDQLFSPSVLDDVMFGPINQGMSREDARKAALETLEQVGAAGLAYKVPNYLSGGEKRLAAIAGVLVMKPDVICMDEPTSDLDDRHRERIERLIRRLRDEHGISVVIATHDLNIACRLADRVCIVRSGSVITEGDPRDVFYDREMLISAGLVPPGVVEVYRGFCARKGIEAVDRPLTMDELLDVITKQ